MTWTKVEEEVVKKYYQNNTKIYIRESVTNLAGEEWRKIKGFNYSISNYGKVKNNTGKMYIVKSNDNGRGYKQVNLHKNKKRHTFYVHRLVAEYDYYV